ncbi:diguanylate cyclase [Novosphingobium sp.]|uniref:diguanylate cyclase n=1 Tax=Novosphingobium sp. TaxID=1874826 RepID=UPI003341F8E7
MEVDESCTLRGRESRARALWALVGASAYACMTIAAIMLTTDGRDIAAVWPSDAVILALLLSRPRSDWPALLLSGWLANLLANGVARGWAPGIVLYGAINMGQTLLAAQILLSAWDMPTVLGPRRSPATVPDHPDILTDGRTIVRFLLVAGLVVPALGGLAGMLASAGAFGAAAVPSFVRWYASNALGFVIFTPFFKGVFDGSFARSVESLSRPALIRGAALFALHAMVTLLVFDQSRFPLLFLPISTLLLLSFGLGRLATQVGVMLVAVIGTVATLHHAGPMVLIHIDLPSEALFFQVYLAVLLCTAMPVATIVASRAEARTLLAEREELLRLIMTHSPDAILGLDGEGVCRWADGPVRDYLGLEPDALVGVPLATIATRVGLALGHLHRDAYRADALSRTVEVHPLNCSDLTLEASLRMAPHGPGQAVGSVITLRNITVRKAREMAISRRIETDDLTGVFNRAGFRQRLNRAIAAQDDAPPRALTLALIDVDHFKVINDTYGHPVGDAALAEIARRLLAGTREEDVVARLSGDEFAILFQCNLDAAQTICERIMRVIATEPLHVVGNVVVLSSISCGLAQLRAGMSREALFDAADLALYDAKRSGRNAVRAVA